MVKAKTTKRQKDIKSKLIAAICMLLVSTIMMVSSTYAWFTLSTAPEVTGITTQVGANGNLEMALMPATGNVEDVKSEVGDSEKEIKDRNITWGNLVSMQDADGKNVYGLDEVVLYPSQLNVFEGTLQNPTKLDLNGFLLTPTYGADGRIMGEEDMASTVSGTLEGSEIVVNTNKGVRILGTQSDMTQRQLDARNALSKGNRAQLSAQTEAIKALTEHGDVLADIVIRHATGRDEYTQDDVVALENMALGMQAALDNVEDAYLQYVLVAFARTPGIDDTAFEGIKGRLNDEAADIDTVKELLNTHGVSIPALTDAFDKLDDARTNVNISLERIGALKSDDLIEWADIRNAIEFLANAEMMTVNNMSTSELSGNIGALVTSYQKEKRIFVTVKSGGGVVADIADHCGNYAATVVVPEIRYDPIVLNNQAISMETATGVNPSYLSALSTVVSAMDDIGGSGDNPISTFYGYVIDMVFRTNAPESSLVLQKDAVDRIYKDQDGNEQTQGHGSSMTFKTESADFSNDQMKELMKAIRIVFFDPNTGEVIALAELDAENASVGPDGLTAYIKLYTVAETDITEYKLVDSEMPEGATRYNAKDVYTPDNENGTYVMVSEGNYEKATGEEAEGTQLYTKSTDWVAAADGTHYAVVTKGGTHIPVEDNEIMPLTKNTKHALSVLVYLDGTVVENDDVAANAASLVGTMNLQFSSTANLVPMEYADLHPVSGNGGAETPDDDVTP